MITLLYILSSKHRGRKIVGIRGAKICGYVCSIGIADNELHDKEEEIEKLTRKKEGEL